MRIDKEANAMTIGKSQRSAAQWRTEAGADSPAGDLYVNGMHSVADMVGRTGTGSGRCGTVCTGSVRNQCC